MPQIYIPAEHAGFPIYQAFAMLPEVGPLAKEFSTAVYRYCRLSLREMEGARYRTSLINGCIACKGFRAASDLSAYIGTDDAVVLRDKQIPGEDFYSAVLDWATWPGYSERERLAIEFAERMGEQPRSLQGDTAFWDRMHAAFDDKEIVDLTFAVASWIAFGRIAHVLELDDVCPMPSTQAA